MNEETEAFIAQATAGFSANPAARQLAEGELMTRLQHHEPDPERMTKATRELEKIPARRAPAVRRVIAGALILLACAVVMAGFGFRELGNQALLDPSPDHLIPVIWKWRHERIASMTKRPPLFDPGIPYWDKASIFVEASDLHHRMPDDPAIYQVYVAACWDEKQDVPGRFTTDWRRMEPRNLFWAAVEADPIVGGDKTFFERQVDPLAPSGPDAVWINHGRELAERERDAFHPVRTVEEQRLLKRMMTRLQYGLNANFRSNTGSSSWENIIRLGWRQEGNPLPVVPWESLSFGPPPSRSPGQTPASLSAAVQEVLHSGTFPREENAWERPMGCSLMRLTLMAAAGTGLLLCFLAAFERWRRPAATRSLATRLLCLVKARSHARIVATGVLLPAIGAVLSLWLTFHFFQAGERVSQSCMFALAAGFPVLSLTIILHLTEGELSNRLGFAGLGKAQRWPGRAAILVTALWLIAITVLPWVPAVGLKHFQALAPLGLAPCLWLLWQTGGFLFRRREAALPGVMICGAALPSLIALTLVTIAGVHLAALTEAKALELDPFCVTGPDATRAENMMADRVTALMRETVPKP